jgi:Domain of unknown function (DUF1707)/FHA domain
MRVSDAERDEAVSRLTEDFAAGRLSQATFLYRMNAALEARQQADLPPLLADLPAGQPRAAAADPGRAAAAAGLLRAAWRRSRPGTALAGGVLPPIAGGHLVRRLTAALRRDASAGPPGPPVLLEFPRGAGTSFTIGRARGCDLEIANMTVSRVHARLERGPDGWLLTDLSSTNGTRVNGWRVHGQVPVRPGDQVSFGDACYSLGA